MPPFAAFVTRQPRVAAAIAFGTITAAAIHLSWESSARMSGFAPVWTLAIGVFHALAGAITGRRLIDRGRTRNGYDACLVGAVTSLLALAVVVPLFALWVSMTNAGPTSAGSFLMLTLLVGVFAFLAAGWALVVVSAGVGWVLHRVSAA